MMNLLSKHMRALSLWCLFTSSIWAEAVKSEAAICSPNYVTAQKKSVLSGSSFNLDKKTGLMKKILREYIDLNYKLKSNKSVSKNFIKTCINKKKELFDKLTSDLKPYADSSFSFKTTLAEYYEFKKDYRSSLKLLDQAALLDKDNIDLMFKRFIAFSKTKGFDLFPSNSSKRLTLFEEDVKDGALRLNEILRHPKLSKKHKVQALSLKAAFLKLQKKFTEMQITLDEVLKLDPQNSFALSQLKSQFKEDHNHMELMSFLKKQIKSKKNNSKFYSEFLDLAIKYKKYDEVLEYSRMATENGVRSSKIFIYQAFAFAQKKDFQRATNVLKLVSKTDYKNKTYMKTKDLVHTNKAKMWEKQNKTGHAYSEYKKAYNYNPKNKQLRVKLAVLLYEYRKELNFLPTEASKKDLEQAISYLLPAFKSDSLNRSALYVMVDSAAQLGDKSIQKQGCKKFKDTYSFMTRNISNLCAN